MLESEERAISTLGDLQMEPIGRRFPCPAATDVKHHTVVKRHNPVGIDVIGDFVPEQVVSERRADAVRTARVFDPMRDGKEGIRKPHNFVIVRPPPAERVQPVLENLGNRLARIEPSLY